MIKNYFCKCQVHSIFNSLCVLGHVQIMTTTVLIIQNAEHAATS